MPTIDSKVISEYFDRLDWKYRVVDDNTIIAGLRCLVPFYDYNIALEVKCAEHWVYVRTLLQRDVGVTHRAAAQSLIGRWNERCHLARFLFVQRCVVVQSEIPAVQCHFGSLYQAIDAVYQYSRQAGVEIAALCTNPSVSALYDAVEAAQGQTDSVTMVLPAELALDFDLTVNSLMD